LKVDPRALLGIEWKIVRANEHLAMLHAEMSAWDASQPWGLVPEVHDQGAKHFYRLGFHQPIPIRWAAILGEAIHDLRSALEQTVYWLTIDWTGKPIKGSSFPVNSRKADFERRKNNGVWTNDSGMHKIRGIGPGPTAFIEALQPYPQRYKRFYCWDVRTVHDLWNQDKHRLVHLWGMRFRETELRFPAYVTAAHMDRRVLQEGAIIYKFFCSPPQPQVHVNGEIGADLAFSSGKRKGGGNEILWDTASTVVDVIRKLVNAVGQQDRPISLDTWTVKGQ
jgi:hypothetical protein